MFADDDDELECSIHDLNNAPPPPPLAERRGSNQATPPRPARHRLWSTETFATAPVRHVRSVDSFPPSPARRRYTMPEPGAKKHVGFTVDFRSPQGHRRSSSKNSKSELSESDEFDMEYEFSNREGDSVTSDLRSSPKPRARTLSANSAWSETSEVAEEIDELDATSHASFDGRRRSLCCGYSLPLCCYRISVNRVAVAVTTWAPPFCCFKYQQRTDRAVLGRLNVLLFLLSLFPVAAAAFLTIVLVSPTLADRTLDWSYGAHFDYSEGNLVQSEELVSNLWNLNGVAILLGITSLVIAVAALLTSRVIRDVDLVGAIRYLWVLVWTAPFVLFCVVGLLDLYNVTEIWVQHWWNSSLMAWFRKLFCDPTDTYTTLCTVPILPNGTAWCKLQFNTTECVGIRDAAQSATDYSLRIFYYFLCAWGLLLLIVIYLAIDTLQRIITMPLVEKSRQSNVPAWLSLPFLGCAALGAALTFSKQSLLNPRATDSSLQWIGPLYMTTAGLFLLGALLGWYASRAAILSTSDKRRKMISVTMFISIMVATFVALATLFGTSIAYSASLASVPLDRSLVSQIACFLREDFECTGCNRLTDRCPEWSESDVEAVLRTQIKLSCTVAAVCMLYSFSAARFGMTLRKHVSTYQIAFV